MLPSLAGTQTSSCEKLHRLGSDLHSLSAQDGRSPLRSPRRPQPHLRLPGLGGHPTAVEPKAARPCGVCHRSPPAIPPAQTTSHLPRHRRLRPRWFPFARGSPTRGRRAAQDLTLLHPLRLRLRPPQPRSGPGGASLRPRSLGHRDAGRSDDILTIVSPLLPFPLYTGLRLNAGETAPPAPAQWASPSTSHREVALRGATRQITLLSKVIRPGQAQDFAPRGLRTREKQRWKRVN